MDSSRKTALGIVLLILIALLVVPLAGSVAWRGFGRGWGMGPGMMGRMMGSQVAAPTAAATPAAPPAGAEAGWPAAAWVLVVLLLAAVAVLAWLVIARGKSAGKEGEGRESPLEIAKRRYVSGEITLPEYEEILHTLTEGGEPLETRTKDQATKVKRV